MGPSFIVKIFQGLKVLPFKEKKIRKMQHVCLFVMLRGKPIFLTKANSNHDSQYKYCLGDLYLVFPVWHIQALSPSINALLGECRHMPMCMHFVSAALISCCISSSGKSNMCFGAEKPLAKPSS